MTTEILLDAPRSHYRPRHIARSELAKIVTLRSTAITVGLTIAACLLVTTLVTHGALHQQPALLGVAGQVEHDEGQERSSRLSGVDEGMDERDGHPERDRPTVMGGVGDAGDQVVLQAVEGGQGGGRL